MNSKPFFKFLSEFGLAGRFGLAFLAWPFSSFRASKLGLSALAH
jgi:hypothetical protein